MKQKVRAKPKNIEIRLIAELMKNSRRSDRDLARVLKVSQPTVTRMRTRLESEGIIKEYTMIPDFAKLGYQLMAIQFLGKQETWETEESVILRKAVLELERKTPFASLMVVNGLGLKKGRMLINMYRDYASYTQGMNVIRSLPHVEAEQLESFIVDLNDKRNFRILSMEQVARHIQSSTEISNT